MRKQKTQKLFYKPAHIVSLDEWLAVRDQKLGPAAKQALSWLAVATADEGCLDLFDVDDDDADFEMAHYAHHGGCTELVFDKKFLRRLWAAMEETGMPARQVLNKLSAILADMRVMDGLPYCAIKDYVASELGVSEPYLCQAWERLAKDFLSALGIRTQTVPLFCAAGSTALANQTGYPRWSLCLAFAVFDHERALRLAAFLQQQEATQAPPTEPAV